MSAARATDPLQLDVALGEARIAAARRRIVGLSIEELRALSIRMREEGVWYRATHVVDGALVADGPLTARAISTARRWLAEQRRLAQLGGGNG